MRRRIAFIHASPAAIAPLMQYYAEAAPELDPVNLLDDGVMRFLSARDEARAGRRILEMIATARDSYGTELALLTCSAVSRPMLGHLGQAAGIPVLKIDLPMARKAASCGKTIGLIVTFPPTLETARKLLAEEGARAGILEEVLPEAGQALLKGNAEEHDAALVEAARRLVARGAGCIVLAQVSMARVLSRLRDGLPVPVFSSLETSLEAVRLALPA